MALLVALTVAGNWRLVTLPLSHPRYRPDRRRRRAFPAPRTGEDHVLDPRVGHRPGELCRSLRVRLSGVPVDRCSGLIVRVPWPAGQRRRGPEAAAAGMPPGAHPGRSGLALTVRSRPARPSCAPRTARDRRSRDRPVRGSSPNIGRSTGVSTRNSSRIGLDLPIEPHISARRGRRQRPRPPGRGGHRRHPPSVARERQLCDHRERDGGSTATVPCKRWRDSAPTSTGPADSTSRNRRCVSCWTLIAPTSSSAWDRGERLLCAARCRRAGERVGDEAHPGPRVVLAPTTPAR